MGLKGRLPNFIKYILSDRNSESALVQHRQIFKIKKRVFHILSVTLFYIKTNSITNCLNPGIDKYWLWLLQIWSSQKNLLQTINTEHHEGLRLTLRAFRTSLAESLYSKAYKPPLKLRIIKSGLQCYCKLKSLPTNPAHDCIFYPKQQSLFDQKQKTIKPFGLRMKHILEETDISLTRIHDTIHLISLPLLLKQPIVILDLN